MDLFACRFFPRSAPFHLHHLSSDFLGFFPPCALTSKNKVYPEAGIQLSAEEEE